MLNWSYVYAYMEWRKIWNKMLNDSHLLYLKVTHILQTEHIKDFISSTVAICWSM